MGKTIVIAGMHRSGTSFTASLLFKSGVSIGNELVGIHESNKMGHYENVDFMQFHRKVLAKNLLNHDGWSVSELPVTDEEDKEDAISLINKSKTDLWGWKDPRTVLFLEFWEKLLPDAYFIFVFRNPWEVIDSLFRRGDEEFVKKPENALKVWEMYNKYIRDFVKKNTNKSLLFNTNDIISDPSFLYSRVNNKFNLELKCPDENPFKKSLFSKMEKEYEFRKNLIGHHHPEIFNLFNQLEILKEGENKEEVSNISHRKVNYFYDWMKLRKTEKELESLKKKMMEQR